MHREFGVLAQKRRKAHLHEEQMLTVRKGCRMRGELPLLPSVYGG